MNPQLAKEKTVVVTGASRGIGLLTTKTLAAHGCHVYATMREVNGRNIHSATELRDWADSNGYEVVPLELDARASRADRFAAARLQKPSNRRPRC